jgi:hypothetical protein
MTKKRSPSSFVGDLHVAAEPADQRVVVQVGLFLGEPPHLDAGDQQEGAEDVEHPVELAISQRRRRS